MPLVDRDDYGDAKYVGCDVRDVVSAREGIRLADVLKAKGGGTAPFGVPPYAPTRGWRSPEGPEVVSFRPLVMFSLRS